MGDNVAIWQSGNGTVRRCRTCERARRHTARWRKQHREKERRRQLCNLHRAARSVLRIRELRRREGHAPPGPTDLWNLRQGLSDHQIQILAQPPRPPKPPAAAVAKPRRNNRPLPRENAPYADLNVSLNELVRGRR